MYIILSSSLGALHLAPCIPKGNGMAETPKPRRRSSLGMTSMNIKNDKPEEASKEDDPASETPTAAAASKVISESGAMATTTTPGAPLPVA